MKTRGRSRRVTLIVFCCMHLPLILAQTVTEKELKELRSIFEEITRENTRLTVECETLQNENTKLWTELNRLVTEVKELQQHTRIDNIEIAGIPQRPNEDVYDVLEKVSKVLQIKYNRNEISDAHRLPQGNQGHPFIIVRFISRQFRDKWLRSPKGKTCDVQKIYPDAPSSPFYVNQHLTSHKKGLLDMAKRLVNEKVYTFAWVKDGKVYVRKTPTSHVIRIRSFNDFDQTYDTKNITAPLVF